MAVLVALVFLSCLSSSSMLVLDCSFQIVSDKVYVCINANMEVEQSGMNIQELSGDHLKDKENSDVSDLYLMSNRLSFIPRNWSAFFPNLKRFFIYGNPLTLSVATENEEVDDDFQSTEVESSAQNRSLDDVW